MNKWMMLASAIAVAVLVAVACGQTTDDPTSTPVGDESPGGIQGVVTDPAGVPVPGMRVGIVSGTAAFPEIGPETDETGYYQIGGIAPGTFQVAVHDREGRRIGLESVVVTSGETATLNFIVSVAEVTEDRLPLPPLPVMRLRHAGRVYDGVEGSYCWPVTHTDEGFVQELCADKVSWEALGAPIPVDAGDNVTIEIEAGEPPQELSASFFELDSDPRVRFATLGPGLETALPVDLPSGVYNIQIFGQWEVGQMVYEFRIEVTDESAEVPVECEVTVALALENPMLVARGVDPIPSGFDAFNGAGCKFATPIKTVTLELHRGGNIVFAQEVALDPPVTEVGFPLSGLEIAAIPADLELGGYDRVIKVTRVDGVVKEVRSDTDSVWLLDPGSSPKDKAREALIAARGTLVESQAIPYAGPTLISFEPVEWNDSSLGCPEPDMMYAQVITPGYRLVFEYQGQQYEYHTNLDGSSVVECEKASTSEPTIFFPQGQEETGDGVRVVMQALLFGELVVVDGCLRLKESHGDASHLLIWPPDFTLSIENNAIQILNGAGQVVARVGDELRISGGEVPAAVAPAFPGLPSSGQCPPRFSIVGGEPGGYWIVGDEVGPAEAKQDPHQIDALLDNPFTLTVGQKVLTKPRGPAVEFIEVVEDSRCPEDVTCIQAGRALILVEVSSDVLGFGTQRLTLEEAGRPDLDKHSVVGTDLRYLFELLRLDPYPSTTATAGQEGYTAILHITTLPKASGQDADGTTGAPDDVELSLQAELVDGSPLTVRLVAEIRGGPDNNPDLYCQGWEWDFGDGMVAAVMPGCLPWTADANISRRFTETYTYDSPGTYEIRFSTGPLDPVTAVVEVR